MAKIVNIPGSTGKTPFELCDEQYFYCTNSEISTLGEMCLMWSFDPFGYMQMGYTNLYFLQRLVLWDPASDIYQAYPETTEIIWDKGAYCIIGSTHLFRRRCDYPFSYSTLEEAEICLASRKISDQNSAYVIARLLEETYWH